MFYPFFGSLSFILFLTFMGASSIIVLIHKEDGVKYTVRRFSYLILSCLVATMALLSTIYSVYKSI